MQFTRKTLKSTSARFEKALKAHNLKLSYSATQNVWAQIVLGKDFSPASASLERYGHLKAINISADSIQAELKARNRNVDINTAYALLANAIGEDLETLSEPMQLLLRVVRIKEGACLTRAFGDPVGLGILESGKPGYLPAGNLRLGEKDSHDMAWLRENSDTAIEVINELAGVGPEQSFKIFADANREGEKKSDRIFFQHFGQRIEETKKVLLDKIIENFGLENEFDCDIDFDSIRDTIFDVFTRLCMGTEWLRPDCNLGETLIDHLAARVRSTINWWYDLDTAEKQEFPLKKSVEESIHFAMGKFFDNEHEKNGV